MFNKLRKQVVTRLRRTLRVRKHVKGSSERPRLTVHRSNQHVFAQIIDDENHRTLVGVGTMSKELKTGSSNKKSKDAAREIGKKLALLAKEKQIDRVVFDRGRYKFHGVIAELAQGARDGGLQF